MIEPESSFLKPTEHLRNLQLLEEISRDSAISQRKLSTSLGVALGVTNACLKKMIIKGYIKVKGMNHKRITYYLTPKGFTEKTKLTYNFLQHTVVYYKNLKDNIVATLDSLFKKGVKSIVFYGAGEVMEVAYICLEGSGLQLIGIIDDSRSKQEKTILGFIIKQPEVIKSLNPDAVLITSIKYKDKIARKLELDQEFRGFPVYSL